jgi:hypothetical protein
VKHPVYTYFYLYIFYSLTYLSIVKMLTHFFTYADSSKYLFYTIIF